MLHQRRSTTLGKQTHQPRDESQVSSHCAINPGACISGACGFSHLKHVSCKMQGNLTSPSFQPREHASTFPTLAIFWGWGHVSSPWLSVLVPTFSARKLAGMGAVDPKSSNQRGSKRKNHAEPQRPIWSGELRIEGLRGSCRRYGLRGKTMLNLNG